MRPLFALGIVSTVELHELSAFLLFTSDHERKRAYWEKVIINTFLAIDFGTTQSSVALITEASTREPQVVEINNGQSAVKTVATALQLDTAGNIAYFGSKAVEKSEEAAERTSQNFKMFTGDNGREYQVITGQGIYTPDKLALMYLTHIRKQLEEHYFNGAKISSMAELRV